jgi:hypothetical protein
VSVFVDREEPEEHGRDVLGPDDAKMLGLQNHVMHCSHLPSNGQLCDNVSSLAKGESNWRLDHDQKCYI